MILYIWNQYLFKKHMLIIVFEYNIITDECNYYIPSAYISLSIDETIIFISNSQISDSKKNIFIF